MGFDIDHVYGITEICGTSVSCAWQEAWDHLPPVERGRLKARQGVRGAMLEGLQVLDPETMFPTPKDGVTAGEIMCKRLGAAS
jgi:fatty-acyl-CoA synthase